MTHTRGGISTTQLQKELGVTYKTAWRIKKNIKHLMLQNNADLLNGNNDFDKIDDNKDSENKVRKWVFFNTLEFKVVQRRVSS